MMRGYQILSLGVFFFLASLSTSVASSSEVMSCKDFSQVLRFIQTEHLRFQVDDSLDVVDLYQEAADEASSYLEFLGYRMLATQYDKNIRKRLDFKNDDELFSIPEICKRLESSLFRAVYLKAYAKALDPYTDFYLAEEMRIRSSAINGEFIGVGIGTDLKEDHLEVTEVVAGGPSDKQLRVGDRIFKVDQHPVRGMNNLEVRQRIRGKIRTTVRFTGQRKEGSEFDIVITRGKVQQKSVTHSWAEPSVLQIKIHRFYSQTVEAVETLLVSHRHHLKGIILDLRGNSGGLLQAARDLVDLFIEQGVVVYLQGNYEDQVWALREGGYTNLPMVILVNERTASASEIVAGALQDYGRAIVIGQPTYGKHCVQNIYESQNSLGTRYRGGLKLTTLWYYLPSGRSVKYFKPDILLADRLSAEDRLKTELPYNGPREIAVPSSRASSDALQRHIESAEEAAAEFGDNSEKIGIRVIQTILAQTVAD